MLCCRNTRGWYLPDDPGRGYLTAYDHPTGMFVVDREDTWKGIMARPWITGGFQWAGIEHRGETYWPRLCSQSGALDLFLQPKDAYYQNMSHWTGAPMIHLLPTGIFPDGRERKFRYGLTPTAPRPSCSSMAFHKAGNPSKNTDMGAGRYPTPQARSGQSAILTEKKPLRISGKPPARRFLCICGWRMGICGQTVRTWRFLPAGARMWRAVLSLMPAQGAFNTNVWASL